MTTWQRVGTVPFGPGGSPERIDAVAVLIPNSIGGLHPLGRREGQHF